MLILLVFSPIFPSHLYLAVLHDVKIREAYGKGTGGELSLCSCSSTFLVYDFEFMVIYFIMNFSSSAYSFV